MERTASLLGCVWSGVPRVLYVPWSFFLNACGISSPTRVKSRWTLLSYIGGIVTLPCPVTTRSSVPGSTVRATSPGYRSPPPHPLWCQRDGKAKLVPELQAPPPNQSPSAVISHPPTTVVTLCLAFPRLSFGSSRWFSVCVENDVHGIHLSISIFLSQGMFWILNGLLSSVVVVPVSVSRVRCLSCTTSASPLGCLRLEYAEQHAYFFAEESLYGNQKTHKYQINFVLYIVTCKNVHINSLHKSIVMTIFLNWIPFEKM